MFDKILVPLDGSGLSEAILPHVDRLAKGLKAEIVVLSVVDPNSPALKRRSKSSGDSSSAESILEKARERAGGYLSEHSRVLSGSVKAVVAVGNPAEVIIQTQVEEECDLIAMSTRGRIGLMRGLLGSVTDKVLHQTTVPMLIFSPTEQELTSPSDLSREFEAVVVPLDGSELSQTAMEYSVELAKRLSLDIHLIEAINVRIEDAFFGGGYYTDPTPIEEELVSEADDYLSELSDSLRSQGLNAQWHSVLNVAADAILQYADKIPNSFIAMSTRGQSGFTRWLLGSVTEKVVRESNRPVLVIPANESD